MSLAAPFPYNRAYLPVSVALQRAAIALARLAAVAPTIIATKATAKAATAGPDGAGDTTATSPRTRHPRQASLSTEPYAPCLRALLPRCHSRRRPRQYDFRTVRTMRLTSVDSRVSLPRPEPPVSSVQRTSTEVSHAEPTTLFVGLDVHKEAIAVAHARADRASEIVYVARSARGSRPRQAASTAPLSRVPPRRRLRGRPLRLRLYRRLTKKGVSCLVVAPSRIPKAPGERVKTDRRDAAQLARLLRSGDLTSVYVPTVEDEAVRISRERARRRSVY